jgi:hypothetical protein
MGFRIIRITPICAREKSILFIGFLSIRKNEHSIKWLVNFLHGNHSQAKGFFKLNRSVREKKFAAAFNQMKVNGRFFCDAMVAEIIRNRIKIKIS